MSNENRLGIVGGGQLGRMLAVEGIRMGFLVKVMDPTANCPAFQVGAEQIISKDYKDEEATRQLAAESAYLTVELEHVNTSVLRDLESQGTIINPAPDTIEMINNKFRQKKFLQDHGIPTARFQEVRSEWDVAQAGLDFGFPMHLKVQEGGFDGRGNFVLSDPEQAMFEFTRHQREGAKFYVEKNVPFEKELAVMVAQGMDDEMAIYPVVETIHENNICHTVFAPAPVDKRVHERAKEIAYETMRHLHGSGVFGIEMFLAEDGEVLVNEIAPRVHNSGHYTMEASSTSQFEQHIRAVTGLPLGSTEMLIPAAVMVNILGERQGSARVEGLDIALSRPNVGVHIYGKAETKVDRKMGHINAWGATLDEALEHAVFARGALSI